MKLEAIDLPLALVIATLLLSEVVLWAIGG